MLTGVMAGGAHVGGKAYAAAERKLAPGRVIGRELQSAVNGTEFTKEGIDQAARDALSPSGPEEVSPRQTSKASVAPAAEIAGGAGWRPPMRRTRTCWAPTRWCRPVQERYRGRTRATRETGGHP